MISLLSYVAGQDAALFGQREVGRPDGGLLLGGTYATAQDDGRLVSQTDTISAEPRPPARKGVSRGHMMDSRTGLRNRRSKEVDPGVC